VRPGLRFQVRSQSVPDRNIGCRQFETLACARDGLNKVSAADETDKLCLIYINFGSRKNELVFPRGKILCLVPCIFRSAQRTIVVSRR
jgi:hypothetical protein